VHMSCTHVYTHVRRECLYACLYTCLDASSTRMYTNMSDVPAYAHVYTHALHTSLYACPYACSTRMPIRMSIHKPCMHVCTHVHTHECAHVLRTCLYVCLCPCRACMPTPMSAHMLYSYMRINRRHFSARMSTHEPTHMRTGVTARLPMRMPARMLRMRKFSHARARVVAHAYHAHPCAPPLRACPPRPCACAGGVTGRIPTQACHAARTGGVCGGLPAVGGGRPPRKSRQSGRRCTPLRRCAGLHTPSTRHQRCQSTSVPPRRARSGPGMGTTERATARSAPPPADRIRPDQPENTARSRLRASRWAAGDTFRLSRSPRPSDRASKGAQRARRCGGIRHGSEGWGTASGRKLTSWISSDLGHEAARPEGRKSASGRGGQNGSPGLGGLGRTGGRGDVN